MSVSSVWCCFSLRNLVVGALCDVCPSFVALCFLQNKMSSLLSHHKKGTEIILVKEILIVSSSGSPLLWSYYLCVLIC